MKKSRFSTDQIIGILKEQEAGVSPQDLSRKHGVSRDTMGPSAAWITQWWRWWGAPRSPGGTGRSGAGRPVPALG
jgi:hypothetical protein